MRLRFISLSCKWNPGVGNSGLESSSGKTGQGPWLLSAYYFAISRVWFFLLTTRALVFDICVPGSRMEKAEKRDEVCVPAVFLWRWGNAVCVAMGSVSGFHLVIRARGERALRPTSNCWNCPCLLSPAYLLRASVIFPAFPLSHTFVLHVEGVPLCWFWLQFNKVVGYLLALRTPAFQIN